MKKLMAILLFLSMLCICAEKACAQVKGSSFMKATTDTTWNCVKLSNIGCTAYGNYGQEAILYFVRGGAVVGDTVRIDHGASYTWSAPVPTTWGTLYIELNTLTAFPTDSAGTVGPYVKCLGY